MPTIHQKFVKVCTGKSGHVLSTSKIIAEVLKEFPDTKIGSILPNDHGDGNKGAVCWCADTNNSIFKKIRRGLYKVM